MIIAGWRVSRITYASLLLLYRNQTLAIAINDLILVWFDFQHVLPTPCFTPIRFCMLLVILPVDVFHHVSIHNYPDPISLPTKLRISKTSGNYQNIYYSKFHKFVSYRFTSFSRIIGKKLNKDLLRISRSRLFFKL